MRLTVIAAVLLMLLPAARTAHAASTQAGNILVKMNAISADAPVRMSNRVDIKVP